MVIGYVPSASSLVYFVNNSCHFTSFFCDKKILVSLTYRPTLIHV